MQANPNSAVYLHSTSLGHTIDSHLYPLGGVRGLSDAEIQSFYTMLYRGLGLNSRDYGTVCNLPNFLAFIVNTFYEHYPMGESLPRVLVMPQRYRPANYHIVSRGLHG